MEGFSEAFCFWRQHIEPSQELLKDIESEHHYYAASRALGFAVLAVLITGMVVWIIGAIHGA